MRDRLNRHRLTVDVSRWQFRRLMIFCLVIVLAADLSALPAYGTLWMRIYAVNGNADPAASPDKLDQVASRAVTKLVGTLLPKFVSHVMPCPATSRNAWRVR